MRLPSPAAIAAFEDEIADGNIEDAEPERRKYPRSVDHRIRSSFQNIDQRTCDKIAFTRRHFGQMQRRSRLKTMIDVVDDILRCEDRR